MSTLRAQLEGRLRDNAAAFASAGLMPFREVSGAAGLRNILSGRVSAPGCYVYRHRVQAAANQYDDGVEQVVTEQYGVVTVLRLLTDARQADAADQAEGYSDVIRTLVLEWRPDETVDDFIYAGGQLVTLENGYHHWQDIFRTRRILRYS